MPALREARHWTPILAALAALGCLASCAVVPLAHSSSTPLGNVAGELPPAWLDREEEVLVLMEWHRWDTRPAFWGTLFRGLGPATVTTETSGVMPLIVRGRSLATLNERAGVVRSDVSLAGCAFGGGAGGCGNDVVTASSTRVKRLCFLHPDGSIVALNTADMAGRRSRLEPALKDEVALALRKGKAAPFDGLCGVSGPADWDEDKPERVLRFVEGISGN